MSLVSDKSYIYVIATSQSGPVKIGVSDRPEHRLRQLQTAQPEQLRIFHQCEVEAKHRRVLEQFIHAQIGHKRLRGEWFNLSVDDAILELNYCLIRWEDDPILNRLSKKSYRR